MWKKQDDWFWEGNIQDKLVDHLKEMGFDVTYSNTIRKSTGADIIAKKDSEGFIIEVKGWPSDKYVDGKKQGQHKPTSPTLQAKHWLSEAFLTVIRRKTEYPDCALGIALPYYKRYVDLLKDIDWAIDSLGIRIFFVEEDGRIFER